MKIGLYDVDFKKFPNLPLMKISAYHKSIGDNVEFVNFLDHYDKVYVSKVFGDEYAKMDLTCINADEIVYGGTGFSITIEDGKEVYHKAKDPALPELIEHQYPDYALYPELTKDKAFGFLTRGCPNACGFCIVSEKEGRKSIKVADLSEWWNGQKEIVLLDPNILACKDRTELLQQLIDSGARVNFDQGLDARFIDEKVALQLSKIKVKRWHFAFDFMKNEEKIMNGLKLFKQIVNPTRSSCCVYCLTNYDTTLAQDYYRVQQIKSIGFDPDVRVYRKNSLPKRHILRDFQRWCNNRMIYGSCPDFWEYVPRTDGRKTKEIYPDQYEEIKKLEEMGWYRE